jgi:hypothetical protein
MFLGKKTKKEISSCQHKDLGNSERVNELHDFLKKEHKQISKRVKRREIEYLEGLNKISRDVNIYFSPRIIKLLESRLEYELRKGILFRFFSSVSIAFLFLFISTQLLSSFTSASILQSYFLQKNDFSSGNFIVSFMKSVFSDKPFVSFMKSAVPVILTLYFFWQPNIQNIQFLRILKNALIINQYPEND